MSSPILPFSDVASTASQQQRSWREACVRRLILRYREADPWAGERLAYRLAPVLAGYLRQVNVPASDREDLLQDCWIRIHNACHTYRENEPALPWIYAVARHTQLDALRRRRRRQTRELAMATIPERATEAAPEFGIFRLLEQLPESQREIVTLMKVDGLSVQEVAERLSTSEGAVKQKAHRAYARLRSLIHA